VLTQSAASWSTSAWVERRIGGGLTEPRAYDLIGQLGALLARDEEAA
jgi:hypothetical protein